jgi:transmembrane sensor
MEGDEQSQDRRHAQAAQWFARLKTSPVSRGTLEQFFSWRKEEGNAQAFAEAERFWSQADKVGQRPAILNVTQAAMDKTVRRPRRFSYRLVAALALLLLSGAVLTLSLRDRGAAFSTKTGEQRAVALADGSQVQLNTNTHIGVRIADNRRQVVLDRGEALFAVAHDPRRPFTVKVDEVLITATGTRFDVRRGDGFTNVTLIEGGVDVQGADGGTIRLTAGQQWHWREATRPVVLSINARRETAWTQGRIIFDATPLEEALAEINRYTDRAVRLDAAGFARKPISGSFEAGDTASFVAAVSAFLPLRGEPMADGGVRLVLASGIGAQK